MSCYMPLAYPEAHVCSYFHVFAHVCKFPKVLAKYPNVQEVEKILLDIPIAINGSAQRGITWIELYILYRLAGHPKPIANPSNKALAMPSYSQQLTQFKKLCRCVVRHS